ATLLITGQEALGPILLLGTVVVIAGVGIVTSNDITESFDRMALALGVGAALCWGISIVFVRLVLVTPGTDSMGLTGARMMVIGFSAILVYRIGLSTDRIEDTKETRGGSFKYMAWSGILGWVVGASLFFWAVQLIGAAVPTPISSTNPIVAALMGQILGIEQINFKQFTGIIVTVLGIIMIVLA
ncbi:MAG: EamA family transporter, partial [Candidatus Kariarchaeaceae archaeon]